MNPISTRLKVSDIAPTTLRLQPELRDELAREARINNRSLTQEINSRLQRSLLRGDAHVAQMGLSREPEKLGAYGPVALPDDKRMLLSLFDALGPDKQLALLTLLKP